MVELSITKTLAIATGVGYFIAGRRTILGKVIGSIFYNDVNSAMVATYLLYTFSEVERRLGSHKFLKFFFIQAAFSMTPFLNYSGVDWLVYSMYAVNLKLVYRPRAHIFPTILLGLSLLSSKALSEAATHLYLAGTGLLTFEIISRFSMKLVDHPLRLVLKVLGPVFTILPGLFSAATDSNYSREPPFLATESWRKQVIMERIERLQMQRQQNNFNQQAFQHLRQRRQAAPQVVQPDPTKLETLTAMGFDRTRSETALRQTNNDLEQATNLLLSQ